MTQSDTDSRFPNIQVLKQNQLPIKMSKFCVINTEDSVMWNPVTFHNMFELALGKQGDEWTVVNIANGESFPDDVKDYKGIVITGSHYNCRDRDTLPWFNGLCDLIRHSAVTGSPKFYGGCFGCQIIAFALGGEVDCNPGGQFALKAETIQLLQPHFSAHFGATPELTTEELAELNIIVSHGECVVALPPDSDHIATSGSCKHEMFVTGPKKSLICCQSHPEFHDVNYAIHERIAPVVITERKRLNEEQAREAMATFERYTGKDAKRFMDLVSDFLHN